MRIRVRSLALLNGLRIGRCRELWCRSQMQLGSGVAVLVAQASSCSSYSTLSLGTSICHGCSPKKKKKKILLIISFHCLLRGTYRYLIRILFTDLLVYPLSPLLECQHNDARKLLGLFNIGSLIQCLAHSRGTINIFWNFLLNALHYQPAS